MARPYVDFDFTVVDDPDFREDSVREVLLVPLLSSLGFTEKEPYRIIRSRPIKHPYVYIGTAKKNITIIPDYLLQRDGENAWVLDAKAPDENIDSGKNVEQAYSYAIHPEIRVPFYALCNGRKLVVFHISQEEPVLDIRLHDVGKVWHPIVDLLGCRSAWPNGIAPGFHPDFGLAMLKAGFDKDDDGKKFFHVVMSVALGTITKVSDELYSLSGLHGRKNEKFMATFDFAAEPYKLFLEQLDEGVREKVRESMTRQPYRFAFLPPNVAVMTIVADLGDKTFTNPNESYRPFIANEFIFERPGMWDEIDAEDES
jgi:Type I restriction enzyme R protein N terminus (HSDR_N)